MPPISDSSHQPSGVSHVPLSAIAREAGVATSTVSRALRGDTRIGIDTRERVREVARRLGHRAHPLVAALMAQVRNHRPPTARWNLAWLDFHDSPQGWRADAVSVAFYNGVRARAEAAGYAIERVWARDPRLRGAGGASAGGRPTGGTLPHPARLTDMLLARGVRGLLLQGFAEGADGSATTIPVDLNQFAIVGVGTAYHSPALHFASNDQHLSTQLAVRELRRLGYRRIGYIGEPLTETVVANRFAAGYLATMRQEFRLAPLPPLVTLDDDVVAAWVKKHRPEVIISTEKHIPRVLRAHGFSVPHDIGFAHLHVAEADRVTTGICQQSEAVAAAATDLLIGALINNETRVPEHPRGVLIPGRWRTGRTVRDLRS
ncbi:LacI family transcriptional regulator [Opitutaceae bacterium TAV4]|nr:LacI family transcriptional regulator [Opitutaceae bacterium TAV4]RRJ99449.1 LacI family transcriptional regulator [Opitutaceae bacterium TAV3]